MEHKDMNRKKEHCCNGDTAVEDQDDWNLIKNHSKQAAGKGSDDQYQ